MEFFEAPSLYPFAQEAYSDADHRDVIDQVTGASLAMKYTRVQMAETTAANFDRHVAENPLGIDAENYSSRYFEQTGIPILVPEQRRFLLEALDPRSTKKAA